MNQLSRILEAIIFVSDQPMGLEDLQEVFEKEEESIRPDMKKIEQALAELQAKFQSEKHAIELRKVANGYQFMSKPDYFAHVRHAVLLKNKRRLSRVMLETLAIIAYRQPITKAEIEFIRGVSSDYAVQKLLEKKLIIISGRSEDPGRPLLYNTSDYFMQYFGINQISDLPKLKEFEEQAEDHLALFRQHQQTQESESHEATS